MKHSIILFFLIAIIIVSATDQIVIAQTLDKNLWVTNSVVNAIVRSGGTIYIGGAFDYVGPATGGGAAINTGTGKLSPASERVNGWVNVVVSDGSGGWYIGGDFTKVGDVTRNNLARINADGTLNSSWNPDANAPVTSIAVSGSKVYVGGQFSHIGTQDRNCFAVLNATNGNANNCDLNANGTVYAIAICGSKVFLGGSFTYIGGLFLNHIAAIDIISESIIDLDLDTDGPVLTFASAGVTLFVGGQFTSIGGVPSMNLGAIDIASETAMGIYLDTDGSVKTLAFSGSTLYVGGHFTSIGTVLRKNLAAFDCDNGELTSWNPNPDAQVYSLAVSGSTIYVGGDFRLIGGSHRNFIASIDASGPTTNWDPCAGATVKALAVSGTSVYAGGFFTSIGGVRRNGIAALDAETGIATSWNPDADGQIFTLSVSGTTVYVGGEFMKIGNIYRPYIAAINAVTGTATSWDPHANGIVWTLSVAGSTIYVGGGFTMIGGQNRSCIAAFDAVTGNATPWHPNANGAVYTLSVSGSTVYVGGWFSSIGGSPRQNIAALDAQTGNAITSWDPDANDPVHTLSVSGPTVYVGGDFSYIGRKSRSRIAAIDAVTGDATADWDPNIEGGFPPPIVNTVTVSLSKVYVGGLFTSIHDALRNSIGTIDLSNGMPNSWDPKPLSPNAPDLSSSVKSILVYGSTVYVGGNFEQIGGEIRSNFAGMTADLYNFSASYNSGWNMASVPIIVPDPSKQAVWSSSISSAFWSQPGVGYVEKNPLENRLGYWIKFPSAGPVAYMGELQDSFHIGVKQGWNMIGSLHEDLQTSRIYSDPSDIISSRFYGYNSGYYISDYVKKGDGFWVKVNNDGILILDMNSEASSLPPQCSDEPSADPPGAPSQVSLVSPSNNATGVSITPALSWSTSDGATTYALQVSSDPCFTTFVYYDTTLTTTSQTIGPLAYSTVYYWRVRAKNSMAIGRWSNRWTLTTRSSPHIDPCQPIDQLSAINNVSITDSKGNTQKMYVHNGDRKLDPKLKDVELPPTPPPGIFDVRFDSDKFMEIINPDSKVKKLKIKIKDAGYPILFSWDVKDENKTDLWLKTSNNGNIALIGTGSVTLNSTDNGSLTVETMSSISPCQFYKTESDGPPEVKNIPTSYSLDQNFPNPFNPTTVINYQLPENGHVALKIFDVLGKEVATLVNEYKEAGYHNVEFNATNLSSGVYFYKLQAGNFVVTKKMLLAR